MCTVREREREKEVVASVVTAHWRMKGEEIVVSVPHLCIPLIVISCSPWVAVVFPLFGFSTLAFCVPSPTFLFSVLDPTSRLWPSIAQRINFLTRPTVIWLPFRLFFGHWPAIPGCSDHSGRFDYISAILTISVAVSVISALSSLSVVFRSILSSFDSVIVRLLRSLRLLSGHSGRYLDHSVHFARLSGVTI